MVRKINALMKLPKYGNLLTNVIYFVKQILKVPTNIEASEAENE